LIIAQNVPQKKNGQNITRFAPFWLFFNFDRIGAPQFGQVCSICGNNTTGFSLHFCHHPQIKFLLPAKIYCVKSAGNLFKVTMSKTACSDTYATIAAMRQEGANDKQELAALTSPISPTGLACLRSSAGRISKSIASSTGSTLPI
jgi:hypothetical protein